MFGRATIRLGIGPHSSLLRNTAYPCLFFYSVFLPTRKDAMPALISYSGIMHLFYEVTQSSNSQLFLNSALMLLFWQL